MQDARTEMAKKRKKRKRLFQLTRVLFLAFFLVFAVALWNFVGRTWQDSKDIQAFESLNKLVTEPGSPAPNPEEPDLPLETVAAGEEEGGILAKYQTVYEMNQDMYGWISIDGLDLSYPVMYTPEDEEYYLRRGFDRTSNRSGVPFIDGDCHPGCGNLIIYGHNMTNGTMFSQLMKYAQEDFWKEHPEIRFDTLTEEGRYEIIGTFYSRVYYLNESSVFRYYDYTDLRDPDVFQEYVDQVKASALYETGVEASYGDELITLSTCSYDNRIENERFVVVAKKIS